MNKALEAYDIKTNYRKASSVAKHPKPPKSDKSPKTFTEATAKERPVKKKEKSEPRVGKLRASKVKGQAKQYQKTKKGK